MIESAQFNPQASPQLLHLGREKTPLIVIDDALLNPEALIEAATEAPFQPVKTLYPGLNAPLPQPIAGGLYRGLAPLLAQVYGLKPGQKINAMGYFGLVTARPDALSAPQAIPHYDRTNPEALAILMYLCEPRFGGTGFYRHASTGFERIDAAREPAYNAALDRERPKRRATPDYFSESADGFELIGKVAAEPNRIAIYPSNLLHSGLVDPATLTSDPKTGRLTANLFLT